MLHDNLRDRGESVADPKAPVIGQWEHYAVTVDQPTRAATVYRNGVVVARGPIARFEPRSQILYWSFGHSQDPSNPGDSLNGQLDDIQIHNSVLSAAQIQQLAKKTPSATEPS